MAEVKFYKPSFVSDTDPAYSVIVARCENKWIFVRHRNRKTWEIAGGHIEKNESSSDAARRELMEETGALKFDLVCVATYSVKKDGLTGYGKLYFAEVYELAEIPDISEVAEIKLMNKLPENLTYPDIQPHLFRITGEYLKREGRI